MKMLAGRPTIDLVSKAIKLKVVKSKAQLSGWRCCQVSPAAMLDLPRLQYYLCWLSIPSIIMSFATDRIHEMVLNQLITQQIPAAAATQQTDQFQHCTYTISVWY